MDKHFYGAIATLVGCIIGAGVLGMPYVIAQAGFLTGMLAIVFLGIIVLFVYLYLGGGFLVDQPAAVFGICQVPLTE